jgi:hypothetical protein
MELANLVYDLHDQVAGRLAALVLTARFPGHQLPPERADVPPGVVADTA